MRNISSIWMHLPAEGGRICSYNRNTEEFDIIKEYAYAMPKLCLYGEYLAFLQQAGENTDRLYIYHLETGESVTPKVFEGSAAQTGGIHLDGTTLTYAVTYYEDDILMSRVTTLDLTTGLNRIMIGVVWYIHRKKMGTILPFCHLLPGLQMIFILVKWRATTVVGFRCYKHENWRRLSGLYKRGCCICLCF